MQLVVYQATGGIIAALPWSMSRTNFLTAMEFFVFFVLGNHRNRLQTCEDTNTKGGPALPNLWRGWILLPQGVEDSWALPVFLAWSFLAWSAQNRSHGVMDYKEHLFFLKDSSKPNLCCIASHSNLAVSNTKHSTVASEGASKGFLSLVYSSNLDGPTSQWISFPLCERNYIKGFVSLLCHLQSTSSRKVTWVMLATFKKNTSSRSWDHRGCEALTKRDDPDKSYGQMSNVFWSEHLMKQSETIQFCSPKIVTWVQHDVDDWNPAPPGLYINPPYKTRFYLTINHIFCCCQPRCGARPQLITKFNCISFCWVVLMFSGCVIWHPKIRYVLFISSAPTCRIFISRRWSPAPPWMRIIIEKMVNPMWIQCFFQWVISII